MTDIKALNILETEAITIIESAIALSGKENAVKVDKAAIRLMADSLINYFVDNGQMYDLPVFLTELFEDLQEKGMFGADDVFVGDSKQKLRTLNKQRASRFFQRSFDSLKLGLQLKGNSPFRIKPEEPKVILSDLEKLVEVAESLGMDITSVNVVKVAFQDSKDRATERRKASDKRLGEILAKKAEQKAFEVQQQAISTFLSSGLTVEDILKAQKEQEKQASK